MYNYISVPLCWAHGKVVYRGSEDEMVSTTGSTGRNLSKLWAMAEDRGAWRAAVHGVSGLDTA